MADRLEREIEEIIRGKGDLPEPPRRRRREVRRAQQPPRHAGGRPFTVAPGAALFASVGLLMVAVLLWNTAQGLGLALVLGAVVLFILALALAFSAGPPMSYEKRWRGQRVAEGGATALWPRLRSWWRRLRP